VEALEEGVLFRLPDRLLDDQVDAAVWSERDDRGGDQHPWSGLGLEETQSSPVLGRQGVAEPAQFGQVSAEGQEPVECLVDRIPHEIADHVFDQRPAVDLDGPGGPALRCRGPALAQEHPGQLVLLGHVVQLVPREIGAVVAGRGVVGEREEADLGPVHDFPTARGAIAPWWHAGRASGCRPGYTFDHAGDRRLRPV
jgi:hypothetical protein